MTRVSQAVEGRVDNPTAERSDSEELGVAARPRSGTLGHQVEPSSLTDRFKCAAFDSALSVALATERNARRHRPL